MARKGSGFKAVMGIVKSIERAVAQAAREAKRQHKKQLREEARLQREEARLRREKERLRREEEREMAAMTHAEAAAKKREFKQTIDDGKTAFEKRCAQRKSLREAIVNSALK